MAPISRQRHISKNDIPSHLASLKTVVYNDPASARSGSGAIRSIAWNATGTAIATGAGDKTLRVWNPERPVVRSSTALVGHASAIEKVAFNPAKESELCSVSSDGVVKFWDVKSRSVTNEVSGLGKTFTLAWSPDGSTVVVGNKADTIFVLSPSHSTPLATHQQPVQTHQMTFCYSGKRIFLTTGEGRVKILSYPDFQPAFLSSINPKSAFALNGHTSACLTAEMQPSGRFLASGGSDSIIALWDTTDWICRQTLTQMTGPVRSISFSWDGAYVVGGSDEGNGLEIAHAEDCLYVYSIKTTGPCPIVAWHPSKYCLAYSELGILKILGYESDGTRK